MTGYSPVDESLKMTAIIEATSGTYRSRVDGTIVLSVEISPIHAKAALELFGMPGTSIAIAALKDGHGAVSDKPETHSQGPLCKWLVIRCREPQFQEWISSIAKVIAVNEAGTTGYVKKMLGINSRIEIDGNEALEDKFHRLIRIPYSKWLEK